jgi:hypothetical protein
VRAVEDWKLRAAGNESAFRRVNEGLRAGHVVADTEKPFPFRCECGLLECNQLVELTLAEYEGVRTDGRRFFIAEGHELEGVETVVERHERYWVVQKTAGAARVAEQEDPRQEDGVS